MKYIRVSDGLHERLLIAKARAHVKSIEQVILVRGDSVDNSA